MSEAAIAEIKPIETNYGGCRFRSRLEARWAVFFDALGLRWEYEPEAYALPSGNYLPDFRLHLTRGVVWFEVKPDSAVNDLDARWAELGELLDAAVFVAFGMPRVCREVERAEGLRRMFQSLYAEGRITEIPDVPEYFVDFQGHIELHHPAWDYYQAFCICERCGAVGIEYEGRAARICGNRCFPESDRGHNACFDRRLIAAYERAHSARFEPRRGAR